MRAARVRPAFDADPRSCLLGWYDLQRGIVLLKCEGLSDDDARRSIIATSPLRLTGGHPLSAAPTGVHKHPPR